MTRRTTPALSRRRFLGATTAAAGAAASAAVLGGCADEDPEVQPGADTGSRLDGGWSADAGSDVGTPDAGPADVGADVADTAADAAPDVTGPAPFRFAIVADTHIIDEWYEGPESNELDTESMFHTFDRFTAARDVLKALDPPVEFVAHVGDLIHDYPSYDLTFFENNRTRLDIAADIVAGFELPFLLCLGNHDYEFGNVPRADTHALFASRLEGFTPYSAYEHGGWKFIMLDCYLGATHDESLGRPGGVGSLGTEQLEWLRGQLQEGKPCFLFVHQMLSIIEGDEGDGLSLAGLVREYSDVVKYVISGHTHRWLPFGEEWGVPHMVIGATRYDEDCFVVVDVDPGQGTFTFVNEAQWQLFSPYAEPYEG